jgi:hypothetical protein
MSRQGYSGSTLQAYRARKRARASRPSTKAFTPINALMRGATLRLTRTQSVHFAFRS